MILRRATAWLLASIVTVVDLGSGAWARAAVPGRHADTGWLRLELVANRGVAFGIGSAHPAWALAVSAAMVLLLAVWLARSGYRMRRAGLALALGGGAGNLIDRAVHGFVTDWIHVAWYPETFNLADLAIRAGLLIVLASLARNGLHDRARSATRS